MSDSFLWLSAAIALFLFEIMTPGVFFFACLGMGALMSALASSVGAPPVVTWPVFVVVSVSAVHFLRPLARKYASGLRKKSNVDALSGRRAPLMEKIAPPELGLLKIDGELWKASSDEAIEIGALVEVSHVEGTHVVVKKVR